MKRRWPGSANGGAAGVPTPRPSPTPASLAELRATSPDPIFVPTDLPPGLTPEPPIGGPPTRIDYHDQSGAVALTVLNGPAGCCLAAVSEQVGSLGTGTARAVTLTFDPRPNDPPHELLTLEEHPASAGSDAGVDSQVTTETIAGHAVAIVHRGRGCVSASWTQAGLRLTLTNPYDPPGPPGAVRYSCDQLRKIVGSVG